LRKVALFLALVLSLGLVVSACGGSETEESAPTTEAVASENVPADAVALVGDEKIPKASYDALIEQAKKSYEAQDREFPKAGTAEYEALKNQAVQYLVQRAQFEQEAKEMGITITDADVDNKLEELKEQYFGGDEKKFDEQVASQGLTLEQVRADVRAQLVSERIFEQVTKDVGVTDDEIQTYYDENEDNFAVPKTRDVRHILVKTKKQADELRAQLEDGADFAALAKKFSEDPGSKDNGGKYEDVQQGQFVKAFDDYLFSAETNALSEPIKTSFGWHLIEPLAEIKPATTTPFAEVQDSIRQQLEEQGKNEAMSAWVDEIQRKFAGLVTYAVGFAPPPVDPAAESVQGDTGASTG
jgi:foldase protein PrsA